MIPFLTSTWLRGGLAVGLVVLIAGLGWRVTTWRTAYKALPAVEARLEAERLCGTGSDCAARVAALKALQAQKAQEVVSDYEAELKSLRDRPIPARVIRVCRPADTSGLRPASPASGPDGTGPAAGVVSGTDEFDTGPLRELAREADELSARLRALQEWNQALSAGHTDSTNP